MKMFLLGVLASAAAAAAIAAGVVFSGAVDVAADTPHFPLVFAALDTARDRAVERAASGIKVPGDLTDPARVRRGAGNYDAMCAQCHLHPGETDTEIRKGLYPVPPDLTRAEPPGEADEAAPAAERFWVIKHGLKATGMAAWGRGGLTDADIWDLAAFLEALPKMSPEDYRAVVLASGGHHHGGFDTDHHDDGDHDHGTASGDGHRHDDGPRDH